MVYCDILFFQTEKRQKQILTWWCRETGPWEVDWVRGFSYEEWRLNEMRGWIPFSRRLHWGHWGHSQFSTDMGSSCSSILDFQSPLLCNINFCCFNSWEIVFYISVINQVVHHCQCNLQNCKSSSQNWNTAQWDNVPGTSHFVKFWRSHTHLPATVHKSQVHPNCSQVQGAVGPKVKPSNILPSCSAAQVYTRIRKGISLLWVHFQFHLEHRKQRRK